MTRLSFIADPNSLNAPYEFSGDRNESIVDLQTFPSKDLKRYI